VPAEVEVASAPGCLAQTNLQLFGQLVREGYEGADLALVRDAYALAMRLFCGRVQVTGKDFMGHCVGTASVLAWLRRRAPVVAAGLVHNAYQNGDFGSGEAGETPAKRSSVRRLLGSEVEEYLHRFPRLTFNQTNARRFLDASQELDPIDREVVLIHLADRLEKHVDLDMAYYGREQVRDYYARFRSPTIETARRLGFPQLAAALERAYGDVAEAELPAALIRRAAPQAAGRTS
jgi:(p)ppGpp synthase/HD superfamily hydrolase